MQATVYIETTITGYLTAWPSRDVVFASRQQLTREWWRTEHGLFTLVTSELIAREAGAGDPLAAKERLEVLSGIRMLQITDKAIDLGKHLLAKGALPTKATADALHVAIAATNAVDYLLTWNCRHLANATMRDIIDEVCMDRGFRSPVICTPEELISPTTLSVQKTWHGRLAHDCVVRHAFRFVPGSKSARAKRYLRPHATNRCALWMSVEYDRPA